VCEGFFEPVDWIGYDLTSYPYGVPSPMDLGTIEQRVERGHYLTVEHFSQELQSVWTNAMGFNAEGSSFFLAAEQMLALSKQAVQAIAGAWVEKSRLVPALMEGEQVAVAYVSEEEDGEWQRPRVTTDTKEFWEVLWPALQGKGW
jgi:hypothetical protein